MRSSVQVGWPDLLKLDKQAPTPLYYQLRECLRTAAAALGPGSKLPSEKELVELTGVSRQTARKAISDLVHEGVLRSEQGKGTFAAAARVETHLEGPRGFTETISELGHVPSTTVRSIELAVVDRQVAEVLKLPAGAAVWCLERLRLIDGQPGMLERSYLPAQLAPELASCDLTGSLYDVLRSRYGISAAGGSEVIIATVADRELARVLEVAVGDPVLTTARTTEMSTGQPFEYAIRHARADLCSFRVCLDRDSVLTHRSVAEGVYNR